MRRTIGFLERLRSGVRRFNAFLQASIIRPFGKYGLIGLVLLDWSPFFIVRVGHQYFGAFCVCHCIISFLSMKASALIIANQSSWK